jgi:hypothetical protein
MSEPSLLHARDLGASDRGRMAWRRDHNADALTVSADARTVTWAPGSTTGHPPAWIPIETEARLFGGAFEWDFVVEEMAAGQIGVGFMLAWDIGPDWGFFGYLGSSTSAWAYDLSSGDVVYATKSIEGSLPRSADARTGVVTVRLEVPADAPGAATFRVAGVDSRPIELPAGAVVIPAACLLRETQRVRLVGER